MQVSFDVLIERENFFSMGDPTRNLVSLIIRLVPLPFEPFRHKNRRELTVELIPLFIVYEIREAAKKASLNGRAIQKGGGGVKGWAVKEKNTFWEIFIVMAIEPFFFKIAGNGV